MPKASLSTELDSLVELIAGHPAGMGIDALSRALGGSPPRRTLQRRLARLIGQKRLQTRGEGPALRYFRAPQVIEARLEERPEATDPISAGVYVPTSPEGDAIRAYVRQPRPLRKPVGYQLAFLEAYRPNQTSYLPQELRDQLHAMGRSPAEQTPAGTFARDILQRLLIDLSWASSQLEGNTYSRLDTERLIAFGQAAEGKNALETQMILNHKDAIEYLVREPGHAGLTPETIIALHAFLSDGLMADPGACGRVRTRAVEIGGSVYRPIALPQRLTELLGIVIQTAVAVHDPFEQAFFLMVHLPYLQPFEHVNKRVSRLAANIPFIHHNLCPLCFIDVPQQAYVDAMLGVYELNRVELLRDVFVWAYERSCQQYVAVQHSLVPLDLFRLRYRQALGEVVAAVVRSGEPASDAAVRARMPAGVPDADQAPFVALILEEFRTLHAGNAVRFGLRPLEFDAWQQGQARGIRR